MATTSFPLGPRQALRLEIEDQRFTGAVVSLNDEFLLVATTLREKPDLPVGVAVSGEVPLEDGLLLFGARLQGYQLAPTLVFVLTRPKALRKVERREHPRYPVRWPAQLVQVARANSLNLRGEVRDLSAGGLCVHLPAAPAIGSLALVLFDGPDGRNYATLSQAAHVESEGAGQLVGFQFSEMSRPDREALAAWLEASRSNGDATPI